MRPFLAALALLAAPACDSKIGDFDLPDWSEGFPEGADGGVGGGGSDGLRQGSFSVRPTTSYEARMGVKESPDKGCVLDTTGGYMKLPCQVETRELDLYGLGFSYVVEVGPDTCDYLLIQSYMYQAWAAGFGPEIVHYQVDGDGNFLADVSGSQMGKPYCEFNHSLADNDAPNCCFGSYQVQVTVVDGGETDLPLSLPKDWGGRPGDCFAGAAYDSNLTEISESTGLPKVTLVPMSRAAGGRLEVKFTSPRELEVSENIWLSNYLETDDPTPVGFHEDLWEYSVACLDHAEEHYGLIEFRIREWDEQAEFEKDGDPNSGQRETAESPRPREKQAESYINDYYDWSDFVLDGFGYVEFGISPP